MAATRHRAAGAAREIQNICEAVRGLLRGCDGDPATEPATADEFPQPDQNLLPIRPEHELAVRALSAHDPFPVREGCEITRPALPGVAMPLAQWNSPPGNGERIDILRSSLILIVWGLIKIFQVRVIPVAVLAKSPHRENAEQAKLIPLCLDPSCTLELPVRLPVADTKIPRPST